MERLLQNLQEQQIHLQQQHIYIHDLANMENVNDGKPPHPPQRKYVSMFHIDGEPILPPLMTTEKRKQMQILKEKALKIEQSLKQRKEQQRSYESDEDLISEKSLLSNTTDTISQRSQDYRKSNLVEAKESMPLLQKTIHREPGGAVHKLDMNITDMSTKFHTNNNVDKLQKLRKSEILIYDNSTNEVIQLPAEKEKEATEGLWRQMSDVGCRTKINHLPNKKPNDLLLVGGSIKGSTTIPLICLNPPTPLSVNKSFCELLSGTESTESFVTSKNANKPLNLTQDISSDESFNSMITQSDQKPNRITFKNTIKPGTQHENFKTVEEMGSSPVKNVCEKIKTYEAISSETNSPQTSPEKLYKNRKTCLGTPTGTMSRSATSPSIKLSSSNRSSSSRSQSLAQESPDNSLVRSSSFTLEGPSEALLEHMQQQQKVIRNTKSGVKSPLNTTRNICRKPMSSPSRAHRDTVESKAKKVQKVELKSSKQRTLQKASQNRLAQVAAASISTCNTNSLCKIKKSPYDISKTSHTSLQSLQKTPSTQMRKSNSTSSNLAQTKMSKYRLTSCISTSHNSAKLLQTEKDSYNHMAKTQKDKFLQLLVQQEEEHQRLQQSFEMQQKLLLEQLNREMAASHLKSPSKSQFPSSMSFNCQNKRVEGHHVSPPQQSQLISICPLPDHKAQLIQNQSKASSTNNNRANVSANRPQIFNSPHSLHDAHYTQSLQSIPHNNSNNSLMDHSNANISFDTSTLSTQITSDVIYATPEMQNDGVNNNLGNKTTPQSRRRLFTMEINSVSNDTNTSNTRIVGNPSYIMGKAFGEHAKPSEKFNHNRISMPSTNESKRRPSADNSLLLHTAATKINAYARGFLVRRLFQTEQIQRIVQTIRDTLLFVLNLHIETLENPEESRTPANIKLKARLLQQLTSACRTLHLVFFQTSIRERMDIIARDRKRIQAKLMSINSKRTPRNAK